MKFYSLWCVLRVRACIVGRSGMYLYCRFEKHKRPVFHCVLIFLEIKLGIMVKVKEIPREVNFSCH